MDGNNELMNNLETYRAQLKQVEAALMIDEDNDDLQKLKVDLEEVITLTLDLLSVEIGSEGVTIEEPKGPELNVESAELSEPELSVEPKTDVPVKASKTDITKSSNKRTEPSAPDYSQSSTIKKIKKGFKWKAGDLCEAIWSGDGRFHDAMISYVSNDEKSCTVRFEKYGTVEVVEVSALKEKPVGSSSKGVTGEGNPDEKKEKPKEKLSRAEQEKRREQRKKKLLKKQQRMKEFEEQREKEKNKWLDFYKGGGALGKGKGKLRGIVKKSIFATPDSSSGKVGVGTCGIGGKGMTSYQSSNQYIYKR